MAEDFERDELELDVLFVGAGPAGLAGAIHLGDLVAAHNEKIEASGEGQKLEPAIAVIEKAMEPGAHQLSGAVMDPRGLDALIPDWRTKDCPVDAAVNDDALFYLTSTRAVRAPITPPPLKNHGNYVVSLNRLTGWMVEQAESRGIDVFPGFPAASVLTEGDQITGVRIKDAGIDKHGNRKGNFEPGADLKAKVTVFSEGTRGNLTKLLTRERSLAGANPQTYGTGIKEVWKLPPGRVAPGVVYHTMGHPVDSSTYGGGWIYGMKDDRISLGYVVGLDYANPYMDPHKVFQAYKMHPWIKGMLEGGEMERYGAKTVPLGGYFSMPKRVLPGGLIIGDSASFLNAERLKGIHLAIESGMMAAKAIFEALLADDYSEARLGHYDKLFASSEARQELYKVRNFHQGFQGGRWSGLVNAGVLMVTGGNGLGGDKLGVSEDHTHMRPLGDASAKQVEVKFDGTITFDKLTDVYKSGTKHEEDQPSHLIVSDLDICSTRCTEEFGNPCQYFCPAAVYEMVEGEAPASKKLQINASNCVHCKTCDIMDPYQIITWVPPEGGGGPVYTDL
ncbi:MAG: electron transfer flavoprotein-ubiquinone oxidoreductase [Candidatus Eisenbacteria bacterium]|uniref:Electron transfer flavoprotein-ubiquinone oxidoreductase n=1 Tax=Eiseniibacteriota bacterium TaxID=2212470 RepID=A0A7Y2E9N3_UNCEI|nr:electron transfer flavoprotein-ubiquinone oxidoreductase [Candidatus Eisenbacteria bacterium]